MSPIPILVCRLIISPANAACALASVKYKLLEPSDTESESIFNITFCNVIFPFPSPTSTGTFSTLNRLTSPSVLLSITVLLTTLKATFIIPSLLLVVFMHNHKKKEQCLHCSKILRVC